MCTPIHCYTELQETEAQGPITKYMTRVVTQAEKPISILNEIKNNRQ